MVLWLATAVLWFSTPLAVESRATEQGRQAGDGPGRGRGPAPVPDVPPDPVVRPPDGPPLFTEDFESGTIDPRLWTVVQSGDQIIAVTQERAAHGKSSLHVRFPPGTAGANSWAFLSTVLPQSLRDHFYGRAYVYISGTAPAHNVYMLAGTPGFPIADFLEIGLSGGNWLVSYQQNDPRPDHPRSETTKRQGVPPFGRWFCLEWELTDKPVDRIVLWVDGQLVANQSFAFDPVTPREPTKLFTSGLVGGFQQYYVGFRAWGRGTDQGVDVFYDDIAIGRQPIGQLPR
jgi:hypothetical protein